MLVCTNDSSIVDIHRAKLAWGCKVYHISGSILRKETWRHCPGSQLIQSIYVNSFCILLPTSLETLLFEHHLATIKGFHLPAPFRVVRDACLWVIDELTRG